MIRSTNLEIMSTVFPLLDLDDDAIVAALGFNDACSLARAELTCRRIRRLADAAWKTLDKEIAADEWNGGDTPRERVLSSYALHGRRGWLYGVAINVASDPKNARLPIITSEELRVHSHFFCLHVSFAGGEEISLSFGTTDEQYRALATYDSLTFLPIPKEKLMGPCREFIDKYYSGTETLGQSVGANGQLSLSAKKDILQVFDYVVITMLAVNRKTLKPSILFRNTSTNKSSDSWIRCRKLRDGTYRIYVDGYWTMGWTMKSGDPESIKNRHVGFFFEDDCYGIFIDTDC